MSDARERVDVIDGTRQVYAENLVSVQAIEDAYADVLRLTYEDVKRTAEEFIAEHGVHDVGPRFVRLIFTTNVVSE